MEAGNFEERVFVVSRYTYTSSFTFSLRSGWRSVSWRLVTSRSASSSCLAILILLVSLSVYVLAGEVYHGGW